jgi:predicted ribosome quality control (RQC) complex YloA/Tae2 family protein
MLLVESGIRIHTTEFTREKNNAPSHFNSKLRKHLKTRKVTAVSQLGTDRIIHITFSDNTYHLFCEFYAAGNIVLTDSEFKILLILRNISSDTLKFNVGEIYPTTNHISFDPISIQRLQSALDQTAENKKENTLKKVLRSALGKDYSTTLVDHCLAVAQLDTLKITLAQLKQDNQLLLKLVETFKEGDRIILECTNTKQKGFIPHISSSGYILTKRFNESSEAVFEEFHPYPFAQFPKEDIQEFDSFDLCVDTFFSHHEAQKVISTSTLTLGSY